MINKRGILLKVNMKKKQLNIDGEWFLFDETLELNKVLPGQTVTINIDDDKKVCSLTELVTQSEEAKGKIQSLNLTIPRLSMHYKGVLTHFYIPSHLYVAFKAQFKPGDYIQFSYNDRETRIKGTTYYVMTDFVRVEEHLAQKVSSKLNKELLLQLDQIEKAPYYAFLDLEFTMSGVEFRGVKFIPEILQFGLVIMSSNGTMIEKFSGYVKPTKFERISALTQDFLKISTERLEYAMPYQSFYDCIKKVKEQYTPLFLVWGVSDAYILQSSYLINEVEPLLGSKDLIDLQRMHRQYYQISQDIGLFNALKSYGMDEGVQIHDAIIDTLVLSRIFYKFKSTLQRDETFPFKENYLNLMKHKEQS